MSGPSRFLLILLVSMAGAFFLRAAKPEAIQYRVEWLPEAARTFVITMEVLPEKGKTTTLQFPAWRPGRYILQNYAAAVSHFQASDAQGRTLEWEKSDKDTWKVNNPAKGILRIQYHFYAGTLDAGSSYIGKDIYYFNPINLLAYVPSKMDLPCLVEIPALKDSSNLQIATALNATATPDLWVASDYHHLADCPVIISSRVHTVSFQVNGADFYLHFQGNYKGNAESDAWLQQAAARLFREQAAIFGGTFPFKAYHCLYILSPYNFRHAVEHATSSCYTLPEDVTSSIEAMRYGLLGITSHEFFHVWNVKRIRPAAMLPYRYDKEAYTRLHWFTEGVTSYMEELCLVRSGLRTEAELLAHLGNVCTSLDNAYASELISCEASSFDTWLSQSRLGNPYHRISFYTQGERAGWILDLLLRRYSSGNRGLDHLLLELENRYGKTGKGVPENGIEQLAVEMAGAPAARFFSACIRNPGGIAYEDYLGVMGLQVKRIPDSLKTWERLGLQVQKEAGGIFLRVQVRPGSDAALAGISDDELIAEVFQKPLAEADLSQLARLKPGDAVEMKVLSGATSRTVTVRYSGKQLPVQVRFVPDEAASADAQIQRENWLRSLLPDEKEITTEK